MTVGVSVGASYLPAGADVSYFIFIVLPSHLVSLFGRLPSGTSVFAVFGASLRYARWGLLHLRASVPSPARASGCPVVCYSRSSASCWHPHRGHLRL